MGLAVLVEAEETTKVRRVGGERLLSAQVVFMAAFGALGWAALIAATAGGIAARAMPPFAWVVFGGVIAGTRLLAFRMLPETPVSLDSAFYIAAVVCLGARPAGWIVAAALTFDALLRLSGADPSARRARETQSRAEQVAYVVYYGGMSGGLLLAIGWVFAVDTSPPVGEAAVFVRVIGLGATLLILHYLIQGVRLWLTGQPFGATLRRLALPGIVAEASLLPLAVVVVLIFHPDEPLSFILLGATYLLIAFVVNRLSHASERLRQRVTELETLNRTARALAATLDRHELVETIGRETLRAIPEAELFALSHRERDGQAVFLVDWIDRERAKFERLRTSADEGLSGWVVKNRRPLCLADLSRAEETGNLVLSNDPGVRSWLGVPIVIYDQVVGVLSVQSRERAAFGPDQQRVAEAIASQAAVAIQNARLYELATIDGLTGLYVRRYFDTRLREELERSRRFGAPFSVVLLDIDDFKKLNDSYGHAVGDRVLREVAQNMKRHLRGVDIAARYGGEEFAFILPRTGILDAHAVAERIRHDIEEARVAHDGRVLRVTASLGVSGFLADAPAPDVAVLLERADVAMYRAKTTGKNRVELYWGGEDGPAEAKG
jgi:diguanylate cyclase (GGDEF)-like protein